MPQRLDLLSPDTNVATNLARAAQILYRVPGVFTVHRGLLQMFTAGCEASGQVQVTSSALPLKCRLPGRFLPPQQQVALTVEHLIVLAALPRLQIEQKTVL